MLVRSSLPRLFGASAMAVWPLVLVAPERRHDAALIAHERVHLQEQGDWLAGWALVVCAAVGIGYLNHGASPWWLLLVLVNPWWVVYLVWPSFRLRAEVRAYRVQIEQRGITPAGAALLISERYRLRIGYAQALDLLMAEH